MRKTMLCCTLILSVALLLAGCSSITGPQKKRVVGILEWTRDAPGTLAATPARAADPFLRAVVAPDTVSAGVPFTVTVTTIGPTTCWQAAGAEINVTGATAVVTPYDLEPTVEEGGCGGDAIVELPRQAQLTFTTPGEAILRVVGRKVVGQDLQQATQVVVERRIHVR